MVITSHGTYSLEKLTHFNGEKLATGLLPYINDRVGRENWL